MKRGEARCWLLRTVSVGTLCVALCAAPALGQGQTRVQNQGQGPEKKFTFDLPQLPLSESLKEYARVSGQQIIFTEDLVWGAQSRPLHGSFSADEALTRLLQGTGLSVEHSGAGILVRREQHAEVPREAPRPPPSPPPAALPQEDVVVTGLIHSLRTNLDIKRNASGLVDAISSEDIGNFPDVDLAAAMQRIPGVTISRGVSSLGGVPTSTGTATQITVRGFGPSFNETLFNDRKVASGVGRAFDFSSVGADFVSEVDVMKSPDAALSAGAIGATVNIKFPKPFDRPGLKMVASASATTSELGNITPNANALISDTFVHDTIGILLDGGWSQSRTRANHLNIQGWEGTQISPAQLLGAPAGASTVNSLNAWYIQDYGVYQETTQDTRVNGRLVLQWRPSDSLTLTLDDNFSRDTLHAIQYGYSVWFNAGSLRNVVQQADGTISSFIQPNTPTDFQSQVNGSVLQNNDTGANLRWEASDRLTVSLDYDHSQAWLNPGGKLSSIDVDVGYGPSTAAGTNGNNIGITLPGGHNLPFPTGYGPGGNTAAFLNNGLIGSHVLPLTSTGRFNRIEQVKAEAEWRESDTVRVVAGYQYIGDHDNSRLRSDFPNNQWQAYAGYGPASGNIGSHGAALPQGLFTGSVSTADFITGYGGANALPPRILAFDAYAVLNYLQGLGTPQAGTVPGFNVGCCAPAFDGTYRMVDVTDANAQVIENTHAGYVTLQSQVAIAGMPLKVNIGLRGEYTQVTTIGLGQLPVTLAVQPSDHTAFQVDFAPPPVVITGHNDYQFLLPNLDLNLGVTDSLQIRFDASRTLTRPPLSQITPVLNISATQRVGSLVAAGGNPDLMPYLSDNLDLSAEWYYQSNSYLSLDIFNKNVTNFIVQGSNQQPINNVMDPTTGRPGIFTVSTNVNGPVANVYGAEFAVQHIFGDTGFGVQANATLVGTDKPYDPRDLTVSGFAVTGLADSANLVLFYDRDGLMARIAANWRDNYLDHFGQVQNNSRFGTEPTFVNATTQLDFSTSYALSRQFSVYFSAQNLNDATFTTHGRFSGQILDLVDYGRRFTLGFHFKY